MLNTQEMTVALSAELPPELHNHIPALAELLVAAQDHSGAITAPVQLQPSITALAEHRVSAGAAQISFGSDNIFHDVTIGDVADGDLVKLNLTFQENPRTTWRLGLIIGGVVVIAVLVVAVLMQSRTIQSARLKQTQQTITAEVLTNMVNLDARLGVAATTLTTFPDPASAATLNGLLTRQTLAELRQAFSERPIASRPNDALLQVLTDSNANPQLVRSFYNSLASAQDDTTSLLETLYRLATSTNTERRNEYLKRIAFDQRMLEQSSQVAYLSGLLALHSLDADAAAVETQLATVNYLMPRSLASADEITTALGQSETAIQSLVAERAALVTNGQEAIDPSLQIASNDIWDKLVGKAIALRKLGKIDASVAAFQRHGEMFRATDPTAEQYSQVAQSFTPQAFVLNVESAMYVFAIKDSSAAQRAGMQVGDIVTAIAGQPIPNATAFEQAGQSPKKLPFEIQLLRLQPDGTFSTQTVLIDKAEIGIDVMSI